MFLASWVYVSPCLYGVFQWTAKNEINGHIGSYFKTAYAKKMVRVDSWSGVAFGVVFWNVLVIRPEEDISVTLSSDLEHEKHFLKSTPLHGSIPLYV